MDREWRRWGRRGGELSSGLLFVRFLPKSFHQFQKQEKHTATILHTAVLHTATILSTAAILTPLLLFKLHSEVCGSFGLDSVARVTELVKVVRLGWQSHTCSDAFSSRIPKKIYFWQVARDEEQGPFTACLGDHDP